MVAASTEDRTLQLRSQRTPPPAELPLRLPLLLQLAVMTVPLERVVADSGAAAKAGASAPAASERARQHRGLGNIWPQHVALCRRRPHWCGKPHGHLGIVVWAAAYDWP
ncbi:hypothetical protein Q4I32_004109 [Leishmania shawi]|uniref:Uncharacterized protein n=1 Tax=Leishmania shawi TaxID=5680 RepID=A0AAW3BUG4_9TRYP